MAELSIIFTLAVILFSSPFLSRYLRAPTPAVEIILGTICAYYGFISDFYLFELIAHIGFFYLMFMAGTEVDLKIFTQIDRAILKKSIYYLLLLYIISAISVFYLDMNKLLIIIIPTLSVGLILALYKDYGKDANWLNLSMLVGAMGELVSISLLTLSGAALEYGVGTELYKAVAYLVLLVGGIIVLFKLLHVLFWWYPEIKIYLMPHIDKEEQDLRLSMALFVLMIGLMIWLKIEIAFGAFIAGIFIATFFEHKKDLPHKISSFGFGFLVPIFFVYIGSTFNINMLQNNDVILKALGIVALMIIIRIFASLVFIEVLGKVNIFRFALSQAMPLTLMIAVATIAYESHSIDDLLYSALILASLFEVIISMLGIKVISTINNYYKSKLN
ncbi:cation:proton antiporter [Sulfurospirillum sp. 1307]|jgi:Kef-type K+ transport system membrane component KefB